MWTLRLCALAVVLALAVGGASADDLTGSSRFLCAAIQATACVETGECGIDPPWNLNIPDFIEVDLEAGRVSTTAASGDNRTTRIEHLTRQDGVIVFHGFERGRAFSWVISEGAGRATVAIADDGVSVAVFGTCTPMTGDAQAVGR